MEDIWDDSNEDMRRFGTYAARMNKLALRLTPFDEEEEWDEVTVDDDGEPAPSEASPEAKALAGAIWVACELLIDNLFEDLREFGSNSEPAPDALLRALDELPPAFASHYDALYLKKFITVAVDLGNQLVAGQWALTCVAQELALRMVLDRVETVQETYGLELDDDWQSWTEARLFEDLDHQWLYNPRMDGFEEIPGFAEETGAANLRVDQWFDPFRRDTVMNPYAAAESTWPPEGDEDEEGDEAEIRISYEETSWQAEETMTTQWLIRPDGVEALRAIDPEAFRAAVREFTKDRPFLELDDALHAVLRTFGVHSKAPDPEHPRETGWLLFEFDLVNPARSVQL